MSRARQAKCLDTRTAENVAAQEINLVDWIFDRIVVEQGSNVLELCCGTGAQTVRLLDLVGHTGQVVALDISREALDILASKLDRARLARLALIESNLDELSHSLGEVELHLPCFDLVFCAYGLYYSSGAESVLRQIKRWLRSNGVIVIVGPFGPNNGPLFDLLEDCGVEIPAYVRYTSQDFMYDKVIPWGTRNFQSVSISTIVNRIKWNSPDQILNYWNSSTFYMPEKLAVVEAQVADHFRNHTDFINEKWIMMVEMADARS